jgi:hypothetical protein
MVLLHLAGPFTPHRFANLLRLRTSRDFVSRRLAYTPHPCVRPASASQRRCRFTGYREQTKSARSISIKTQRRDSGPPPGSRARPPSSPARCRLVRRASRHPWLVYPARTSMYRRSAGSTRFLISSKRHPASPSTLPDVVLNKGLSGKHQGISNERELRRAIQIAGRQIP